MTDTQTNGQTVVSGVLSAVSNAMVTLHKEQFGRGPTKARTHWCGPDALTCLLDDTLTPAERNLVRMGEHQRLRDTRMCFQYATIREFCEPVEQPTGAQSAPFFGATDTEVDGLSMETFLLHRRDTTDRHASTRNHERPAASVWCTLP